MAEWMVTPSKPIRRCVCRDITFRDLQERGVRTVEQAERDYGCGGSCGLCKPYIRKMIETGETEFELDA